MTIKIENLKPGQVVALANCVDTATVIRREAKNLYRLNFKGAEVTVPRVLIAVLRDGRYQHGPVNAS